MKSIEVMASFYKGNVEFAGITIDKMVYKVSKSKKISADKFNNKALIYFEISSKEKIFIIAMDPFTLEWLLINE